MKSLKRFLTTLKGFFLRESVISKEIDEKETIARFITSSRWFSRTKNIVKPQAFMPPRDLNLSTFRVDSLPENEIWEIGKREVVGKMIEPKTLYGRADIKAFNILKTNLQIDPDNTPPRHVNIIGWPELKAEQKSIAQELSADASLKIQTMS